MFLRHRPVPTFQPRRIHTAVMQWTRRFWSGSVQILEFCSSLLLISLPALLRPAQHQQPAPLFCLGLHMLLTSHLFMPQWSAKLACLTPAYLTRSTQLQNHPYYFGASPNPSPAHGTLTQPQPFSVRAPFCLWSHMTALTTDQRVTCPQYVFSHNRSNEFIFQPFKSCSGLDYPLRLL